MSDYVLALDQGTTSSRAVLFDREGRPAYMAQREFPQIFPKPGWVEHDPAAIWSSQLESAREALAQAGAKPEDVAAVGIANQALLLKSCEETLATLDAVGVNLYTGEAEFCKAGGAASYLRRRGKVQRVELSALPAGILREIRPALHRAALEAGDVLVLVSDGVLCGATEDWLCGELERWEGPMQALAEHLASLAVQKRQDSEREDDLTVICAELEDRQ